MKNEWKVSKHNILGHQCVEHKVTKELCIFGRSGILWSLPDKLVCLSSFKNHEEISFHENSELNKLIELIKAPKRASTQLKIAQEEWE